MTVSRIGQTTYQQIQKPLIVDDPRSSFAQRFTKTSVDLFARVATNLNKIAIPAIALCILSELQATEAGPLTYAGCVLGCAPIVSGVAGPAAITCFNWCLWLLPLPGP